MLIIVLKLLNTVIVFFQILIPFAMCTNDNIECIIKYIFTCANLSAYLLLHTLTHCHNITKARYYSAEYMNRCPVWLSL